MKPRSALFAVTLIAALAASLLCPQPAPAAPPEGTVDVLIRFVDAPGAADLERVHRNGGKVSRTFSIVPAVAANLPVVALERMRRENNIAAIEIDAEVQAHDINNTWGIARIACGAVHDGLFDGSGVPETGSGVKVAILDSGIDYLHPDLFANYAGGYDFANNDADPMDDHGHGTHVAGTVAATRDGIGVVGAAHEADIYSLKVLAANGSGSYSWIIAALDWCVDNEIDVANLSLGSAGDPGSTVKAAFDNAEAAGLVIVASAGNSGLGADTVGYPAKYESVIAVAATTSSDARSSFSSTGPAVEIAAPGSSIYSTTIDGSYGYKSGTSMASPHVAGVAALIVGAGVGDANGDGRINDDVRSLLNSTADDLGDAGVDPLFGSGLVNAEAAVLLAKIGGGGGDPVDPDPAFDAPTELGGSVSGTAADLAWRDNSDVEDGFEVQFGTKSKGSVTWSGSQFVTADTTSVSIDLAEGTWVFRVRAFHDLSGAVTSWSNELQLKIGGGGGGGKGGGGGGKGGGKPKR